ncbi:MAG: DUF1122 family protein [Thermoleophilia bacterium]|nr:DUF1122 family protein [Thermoleophilia bacterium]
MALERLEGRPTGRGPLTVASVTRGRFPEELDAVVAAGGSGCPAAQIKYFAGRPSARVRPWLEAIVPDRDDEPFLAEVVAALAGLLPAGSHLMVGYGDDETERGLKRGYPPAATPVGSALFAAGCTWFKDWYYPEGWLEGGFKLQGNKPLTERVRGERLDQLAVELRLWLAWTGGDPDDGVLVRARERARTVLETAAS